MLELWSRILSQFSSCTSKNWGCSFEHQWYCHWGRQEYVFRRGTLELSYQFWWLLEVFHDLWVIRGILQPPKGVDDSHFDPKCLQLVVSNAFPCAAPGAPCRHWTSSSIGEMTHTLNENMSLLFHDCSSHGSWADLSFRILHPTKIQSIHQTSRMALQLKVSAALARTNKLVIMIYRYNWSVS